MHAMYTRDYPEGYTRLSLEDNITMLDLTEGEARITRHPDYETAAVDMKAS